MKRIVPVVLAGGIGERFWPLSRTSNPKQLLPLVSSRPMIEETLMRAFAVKSPGVLPLVITGRQIATHIQTLLSKKWRHDLIVEPTGKNTAPAIALAAAWIQASYGESVMVVLPADHTIHPRQKFVQSVNMACRIAEKDERLIVFAIRPSRPETGYGYLLLGKKTGNRASMKSYTVSRFIEKPDLASARRYCASDKYRWNSGMFVWKTSVLLEECRTQMPELFTLTLKAARAEFSPKAIRRFYQAAEKESIDYGILERSGRVSAVAAKFFWDDIGSWESLARLHGKNAAGTTVTGETVFEKDCRDSLIVNKSGNALAVIGCSNIGVFATNDALLVISREKLPEIKKYLGEMKKAGSFPKQLF